MAAASRHAYLGVERHLEAGHQFKPGANALEACL
jgi:hypothetical protein